MDTSDIPIAQLLPHGPRMRLLDRLVSHDPGASVALVEISADSPFLEGEGVPAWAGIEYMAQTIAAHAGAAARLASAPPAVGFLVGTRAYRSSVAEFPLGSRLTITARPLWHEGGFAMFDCSIEMGAATVASAAVSCYLPSPDELGAFRGPPS